MFSARLSFLTIHRAATALGENGTHVSVQETGDGEITLSGEKSLAFGVELHELRYEPDPGVLKLKSPPKAMRLRQGRAASRESNPAFIGGPEGDILLTLSDPAPT